jgi:hypothetical protein
MEMIILSSDTANDLYHKIEDHCRQKVKKKHEDFERTLRE